MIYLDNGATTFPKPECVYEAMDSMARSGAVNAGRGAYKAAREAGAVIKSVKDKLISLIDAREQATVALTPSVTVALNQVILGQKWTGASVAYLSPYEHNAVARPLELMRKKHGFKVIELPLREDLSIDLERTAVLFAADKPDFVAMTAVSNVTGYILPFAKVFRLAKQYGAFTLLDASQALGLVKLHFAQLKADCVAFAGHKTLYGPFGAAGLYVKNGVDLETVLSGGTGVQSLSLDMPADMPGKLECASKDIVAIRGLDAALSWLSTVRPMALESALTERLLSGLSALPGARIYKAPAGDCQAGVLSFNVDGFKANETAAILDDSFDIAVRAGHHCAPLIHRYLEDEPFAGTVRVSLSVFNTAEDIDALLSALRSIDREMLKGIDEDVLRGSC